MNSNIHWYFINETFVLAFDWLYWALVTAMYLLLQLIFEKENDWKINNWRKKKKVVVKR